VFWQLHHTSCRLIVHRSCPEAEPRLFPLVTDLFTKPVVPAGLLMPEDDDAGGGDDDDGSGFSDAMRWLDEQPKQSVIYVAIGSEAPVDVEVPRDDADGSFRRDAVAAVVRRVMAEDEGVELARNAREMQKVVGDRAKQDCRSSTWMNLWTICRATNKILIQVLLKLLKCPPAPAHLMMGEVEIIVFGIA